MKKFLKFSMLVPLVLIVFSFANPKSNLRFDDINIQAAGATFPYPLYSKMFSEYAQKTNVKVNYQSIGSGGGVQQLMAKTIDFGASDAYLSDADLKSAPAAVIHIPTCLGSDVVTYNLPGNPQLKMTPEVIAGVFLGQITKWNDAKIKAINPGVNLPDLGIFVVHRSDGSGTSFIFTDYLSKVSPEWKTKVGAGKSVNWPVGLGGKGNEGVAGLIKQTPGALGYVELIYAKQNSMPSANVKNKSGNFITPSLDATSLAANVAIPADTRVTITNTDAAQGYPISSFTWLLIYKEQHYGNNTAEKSTAVLNLMWWMIHDGQQYASPLLYAPLPKAAVAAAEGNLKSITWDGKPILK